MGLFCKCTGHARDIEAMKAKLDGLESNLASLRGLMNAKLNGQTTGTTKRAKRMRLQEDEQDDDMGGSDGPLGDVDLSQIPQEFIDSLSPGDFATFKKLRGSYD